MKLYEDLVWRGLIQDVSSPEIEKVLNEGCVNFYWGTDPTADSLHIGHYSSLVTARRLVKAGHHAILLVGGATALIGDPRGKGERTLESYETIEKNYLKLKEQVERITGCETVNNYDWIKDINVLEFLRDYGKHFTVNYMLDKDKVKKQLDNGLSFTEFSYMILQALDFKHLFETRNVTLQVAGSDQWGNITSGIELIRRTLGKEVYGMTMPLVLDEQGNKIGKSEGNAVWLDKEKTSPYFLYQYLLNTDDAIVIDHLKKLTMLSKEEIEELEKSNKEEPHLRLAHKALAREVIIDVHGKEEYEKVLKISEALFSGDLKKLSSEELHDAFNNIPSCEVNSDKNIVDLLVETGICSSKREAREFVSNNSISINGDKVNDLEFIVKKENAIVDNFTIIRKGKKKYFVIKHV
jgi:tyrosyl-tRNA synthetase